MKKIWLVSALGFFAFAAQGQDAVDKAMLDGYRKDKEKSDIGIADPKANIKASFWMDRAHTYESIALHGSEIDSSAVKTAYEAYKKVVELDINKKGNPGKLSEEASNALNGKEGTTLFNAFVKQGAEKFQNKNLEGALEMFELAESVNKKDTVAPLYGGIAAQSLDKKEIAIENYEAYVVNGGKDPTVFYGLAQLYRSDKEYDKAIQALNNGLTKSPDNKDLKSEIVNIYLASGREGEAIDQLTALTKSDPGNIQNFLNLAILYDNSSSKAAGEIKKKQAQLAEGTSKVTDLNKNIEAEKNKLEIYDGEVKRISALLKKQPKNADLKRQLTEIADRKKEAVSAIESIEKQIADSKQSAASTDVSTLEKEIGDLQQKQQNDSKAAIEYYKKSIEIDGKNYDALYNLGAFYFNDAVKLKGEVDNMNMTEYQAKGKEVEGRVCGKFKKAQPYFEKALQVKEEEEAKTALEQATSLITMLEGKGVTCVTE